jgi:transposase
MRYVVKLANPVRTRAIAEARIKTDSVDASTLADLLRANLVAESYIPPKPVRRLREIVRERSVFVKQTTQIKNRIHAILVKRGIVLPSITLCKKTRLWLREQPDGQGMLKHYLNLLDYHEQELAVLEGEICSIAEKDSDAHLLMTIPGIAAIRAMDLLAEIGEISRFPTAEKLCSYAGLVPSVHQSGNTLRFGRLIQQSSKSLKHVFVEASWTLSRTRKSNPLQEFYKKLTKKKGKQKAICATAHKLCRIVYAMLSKKKEFMVL